MSFSLSVYYANFPDGANVSFEWNDGSIEQRAQDAAFRVRVERTVAARGYAWVALS